MPFNQSELPSRPRALRRNGPPQSSEEIESDEEPIEIVRSKKAKRITLPQGVDLGAAQRWLARMETDEDSIVEVDRKFAAYPLEGARALGQALMEKYGWNSLAPTPGRFGPRPPMMMTLHTGVDQTVNIPWGRMRLAEMDGDQHLNTEIYLDGVLPCFQVGGHIKRKHQCLVDEILDRVDEIIAEGSIYKGHAVRVKFPDEDMDPRSINPMAYDPKFMDLSSVNPDELVLPTNVQDQIDESLFGPVLHTDACREHGIPLKRGVLLFGDYGTGKTLTTRVAAKLCEDNGWTFIYLEETADLADAIELARRFQPCMIFAEDIDRAMEGEDRDEDMDEILNTLDGVDGKASEVMCVLTTNNIEVVNRAMLRPGRLDAVIKVERPDADAVARLIRRYTGDVLAEDADLSAVGDELAGSTAAVVSEVCRRVKLTAIAKRGTVDSIDGDDLLRAAKGIAAQVELMESTEEYVPSERENAMQILADAVRETLGNRSVHTAETDSLPNGRANTEAVAPN